MIKEIKRAVLVVLAILLNMRKVILIILLAIVSNSAVAKWEEITSNNNVATNVDLPKAYVNLPIIGNRDGNVKIWFLVDFGKPKNISGSLFMSILTESEYNCKREQIRSLSRTYYSEKMGKGEVIYKEPPHAKWQPDQEKGLWKIACSAPKEWVDVVDSDDNGTIYVNPSSVRKNGNKVKMWSLTDFKTAQKTSFGSVMSIKTQDEFNCEEEQVRVIFSYDYSKNMAKGEVLYTQTATLNWMPVAPDSAGSELLGIACGKL